MSDTPNRKRADGAFRLLLRDMARFKQPEGEGWAIFNLPADPSGPEDFLTTGIERCDEASVFNDDQEAYDFVLFADSDMHCCAIRIHGMCDTIRHALWGDTDRRTPPDQEILISAGQAHEHSPGAMIIEEDDTLEDFIAEARVHADDMPAVIQRDYLKTACDKLADNRKIIARVNTLYDAIAHGNQEHRDWLYEALLAHMAGSPVPAPRSGDRPVYTGRDHPIRPDIMGIGPVPDLPAQMIIIEREEEDEDEDLDETSGPVITHYLRIRDPNGSIRRIDFDAAARVNSITDAVTVAKALGWKPTHYIDCGHGPWRIA